MLGCTKEEHRHKCELQSLQTFDRMPVYDASCHCGSWTPGHSLENTHSLISEGRTQHPSHLVPLGTGRCWMLLSVWHDLKVLCLNILKCSFLNKLFDCCILILPKLGKLVPLSFPVLSPSSKTRREVMVGEKRLEKEYSAYLKIENIWSVTLKYLGTKCFVYVVPFNCARASQR